MQPTTLTAVGATGRESFLDQRILTPNGVGVDESQKGALAAPVAPTLSTSLAASSVLCSLDFFFLPWFGERVSMLLFIAPFLADGVFSAQRRRVPPAGARHAYATVVAALLIFFCSEGFREPFQFTVVLRDARPPFIATGSSNQKQLLVNGIPMTGLRAITKLMGISLSLRMSSLRKARWSFVRHGHHVSLRYHLGHSRHGR